MLARLQRPFVAHALSIDLPRDRFVAGGAKPKSLILHPQGRVDKVGRTIDRIRDMEPRRTGLRVRYRTMAERPGPGAILRRPVDIALVMPGAELDRGIGAHPFRRHVRARGRRAHAGQRADGRALESGGLVDDRQLLADRQTPLRALDRRQHDLMEDRARSRYPRVASEPLTFQVANPDPDRHTAREADRPVVAIGLSRPVLNRNTTPQNNVPTQSHS